MKSYSSREVIKMLKADGWYECGTTGDHHHFKHPTRPGKVTVPHPNRDLKPQDFAEHCDPVGGIVQITPIPSYYFER